MQDFSQNYLESVLKQFKYYRMLGEKTFAQLPDEALFWQPNKASNSIAVIVKHLWGNMLSRWTNFLTEDGEKEWRNRDGEFEADIVDRHDLIQKWEEGWNCLFSALDEINSDNFSTVIYIRNMGHTIPEAINRQMSHYAYHVGQIVYIGRQVTDQNWVSLSVPKGQSQAYNQNKFSQPKRRAHFTDEILEEEQ